MSQWLHGLRVMVSVASALFLVGGFAALAPGHALAATAYYIDCSAGGGGNGSQGSPWNNLAQVNGHGAFGPGDTILFKRGSSACTGSLQPQGSGNGTQAGQYITIDAYGTGPQPIINGGSTNANTVQLVNQQYWVIQNLEITGGTNTGIYITGNLGTSSSSIQQLNYFRLSNLTVHDVNDGNTSFTSATRYGSGLVVIYPSANYTALNDIVVDHVNAYNTGMAEGIVVVSWGGAGTGHGEVGSGLGNVTVQNSTVHDVQWDGIWIAAMNNGVEQNNVVYNAGKAPSQCAGCSTPGALWEFDCHTCTVQNNEAYSFHSPFSDIGVYDVDYDNLNNTFQYNYGHDTVNSCIANFSGGDGYPNNNIIIRYNICPDANLTTWSSGYQNFQVYNNVFNDVNFATSGNFGSGANFFRNNIIYTTGGSQLLDYQNTAQLGTISLDYNDWYCGSSCTPRFHNYSTNTDTVGLGAWQSTTGQDTHSLNVDPRFNNPNYRSNGQPTTAFTLQTGSPVIGKGISINNNGGQDFFGNAIGNPPNIGAYEGAGVAVVSRGTTVNDTDSGLGYSAGWYAQTGQSGYYNGDFHYAPNNGASVSYTFNGTGVAYDTSVGPDRGNVDVSIDGVHQTTVAAYASTPATGQVLYSVTGLTQGPHTLTLVKKDSSYMVVDAVTITP